MHAAVLTELAALGQRARRSEVYIHTEGFGADFSCEGNHPRVFTMASVVTRLGDHVVSLRIVKTVRLLQIANPILAMFTVPFCTRPDPGEDDVG